MSPVPGLPLSRRCQASHFISPVNEKVRVRRSLICLLNHTLYSIKIDPGFLLDLLRELRIFQGLVIAQIHYCLWFPKGHLEDALPGPSE